MHRILFVCLGNICRSPLAEGILRDITEKTGRKQDFDIDSAGTGGWHAGDPPDSRSITVAARNGIDISRLRGRKIALSDFTRFDLVLAMDRSNLRNLRSLAPAAAHERIHLFSQYAAGKDRDVPDPYYGDAKDFSDVYSMLFDGCSSIAERLWERTS